MCVWRPCLAVLSLSVLLVASCAVLPGGVEDDLQTAGPSVEIARTEAVYESIDPSFWPEGSVRRGFSLFLNVWVYPRFTGEGGPRIVSLRLYDPFDNFWTLAEGAQVPDGPIGGWLRLRDNYMSDNGAMLPLRGMRLVVELSDGTRTIEPVSFAPPAASSPRERFLVSEEYRGELSSVHVFAIAQPQIVEVARDGAGVRIVLGSVDRRASNGQIVLLDANRALVGESMELYNDISREPRAFLNGGTRLRTDDLNTLVLERADIEWTNGSTVDDAYYMYVKLRDGAQFAFTDHSRSYLHLTRSRLVPIDDPIDQ